MAVSNHKTHLFFIGGAADQEPYYLVGPFKRINRAQQIFKRKIRNKPYAQQCEIHILGYNKIYRPEDIQKYVLDKISVGDSLYIIAHSLGGWNAAHLSRILCENRHSVKMLITLDPVGEGILVWAGSYIFREPQPFPQADFWINIRTESTALDPSDVVAYIGKQWKIDQGPDINETVNVHHFNAYRIFTTKLSGGQAAVEYLIENLEEIYLGHVAEQRNTD